MLIAKFPEHGFDSIIRKKIVTICNMMKIDVAISVLEGVNSGQ
jgi:hypothetical protein